MATSDKRTYNNASLTPAQVNQFKKKATVTHRVQVKVGSSKINLPVDAFLLTAGSEPGYAFLSMMPVNATLGKKSDGSFEAIDKSELTAAMTALKSVRNTTKAHKKTPKPVEMPAELAAVLKKAVPSGHKIAWNKDGSYSLVKMRIRKKK